jgi:hypothetical protein
MNPASGQCRGYVKDCLLQPAVYSDILACYAGVGRTDQELDEMRDVGSGSDSVQRDDFLSRLQDLLVLVKILGQGVRIMPGDMLLTRMP